MTLLRIFTWQVPGIVIIDVETTNYIAVQLLAEYRAFEVEIKKLLLRWVEPEPRQLKIT